MSGHPTPLAPGDNTPRIMRATGAVSHTGPSGQHPHHRGHEEGNGHMTQGPDGEISPSGPCVMRRRVDTWRAV